ncbi:MAG: hypothetical protein R3F11_17705 [Verrucomicrobiales bacterium]
MIALSAAVAGDFSGVSVSDQKRAVAREGEAEWRGEVIGSGQGEPLALRHPRRQLRDASLDPAESRAPAERRAAATSARKTRASTGKARRTLAAQRPSRRVGGFGLRLPICSSDRRAVAPSDSRRFA